MNNLKKWYRCIRTILSVVILVSIGQVIYINATRHFGMKSLVDVRNPILILFACFYCIVVVIYTLFLHWFVEKKRWSDFGFRFKKKEILVTIIAIIIMVLGFIVMVLLTKKWGVTNWRWAPIDPKAMLGAAFVYLTVGLNEEFYFRGYVYKNLTHYNKVFAYIISGVIFVTIHFMQQTFSIAYLIELLICTFMLTFIYDITKSIWPGVLIHGAIDFCLGLFQGSKARATIIIWFNNRGSISISDLLMVISIITEIMIIFLFFWMYRQKIKGSNNKIKLNNREVNENVYESKASYRL